MTCKGYNKSGERCGTPYGLSNGYCYWHNPDNLCRGNRLNGVKCKAPQKERYAYCCADHNPVNRPFYIEPSLFKIKYLRNSKQDDIVQLYDNKDIYHGRALPSSLSNYQLDHKFELQSAAYAVREADIQDAEEKGVVIGFLRDEVLNEDPNLCLTSTSTNQFKGTAVKNLLDDMRTGHLDGRSKFTDYMLGAAKARDNTKVPRKVTKAIRTEMKKANKYCQGKLEDESETPSFRAVKKQFKKLYIAMRK